MAAITLKPNTLMAVRLELLVKNTHDKFGREADCKNRYSLALRHACFAYRSLGSLTVNEGEFLIDATKVRWLQISGGSGAVR